MQATRRKDCVATYCGWADKTGACAFEKCPMVQEKENEAMDRAEEEVPKSNDPTTFTTQQVLYYSHSRWDKLLAKTIEEIRKLSALKGGEYAGDTDRLANFRRNGQNLGLPMETIWAVYAGKHWDAIMQYIRDEREGKTRTRLESINGRVDDLIVYALLLKAMLEENGE